MLTEQSNLYKDIQGIYGKLQKQGDIEDFYVAFYAKVALHSVDYFPPLTTHAATFLATKVADGLLIYHKKSLDAEATLNPNQVKLSQDKKDGLGYLGGYVL